jgi:hypothetical protein
MTYKLNENLHISPEIPEIFEDSFKEYSYTYGLAMKPPIWGGFLHIQ